MLDLFKLEESFKTNLLVSGANASGKTKLSCSLASQFYKMGYTCIVVDISGAWKHVSDLPYYSKVTKVNNKIRIPKYEQNTSRIYDLSTLKLSETKQVVEKLSELIWNERIEQINPVPTFLFLEESEGFLKNIRGKQSESIYRLVHVGRNINVRCILITTDLALLDASVIRLCGIRLYGYLNPEENSKRKFRAYHGSDWCKIAMEGLDVGDFIRYRQYNRKKPLDVISVPLFIRKTKPRIYIAEPKIKPIIYTEPKPQNKLLKVFKGLTQENKFVRDVTPEEDLDNEIEEEEDAILFL